MTTFLDYKMTYKKNKLCLLLAPIVAFFTILFHLNSKRSYTLEINIYFEDFTFSKRSSIQVLTHVQRCLSSEIGRDWCSTTWYTCWLTIVVKVYTFCFQYK